jgi:hypothetical protein
MDDTVWHSHSTKEWYSMTQPLHKWMIQYDTQPLHKGMIQYDTATPQRDDTVWHTATPQRNDTVWHSHSTKGWYSMTHSHYTKGWYSMTPATPQRDDTIWHTATPPAILHHSIYFYSLLLIMLIYLGWHPVAVVQHTFTHKQYNILQTVYRTNVTSTPLLDTSHLQSQRTQATSCSGRTVGLQCSCVSDCVRRCGDRMQQSRSNTLT